jgi:DNA polymerase III subunit delta'
MISINSLLPWQEKNWLLLYSYIKHKRIPNGLLITGTKGLGKHLLAEKFAASLLCSNPQDNGFNCGRCNACLLIKAKTHPDFFLIKPDEEKSTISINQIRQLITIAYLKPQFETYRVALINPADAMTSSAANAFLKCLEEPTERTIFVLITDKPNKLPATIVSRCQKLSLALPEKKIMLDWLEEQGIHDNQETLLKLVQSSVITTQQISDDVLLKQRKDCFNDWMAIANNDSHPVIVSEQWQTLPGTELINWLVSWVTDLIKCSANIDPKHLCNQDLSKTLQELSQQMSLKNLFKLYDLLITSRQCLGTQINFQLMLEEILVQWQELNVRT